jgi:succinoglycan biosynthesis protein ExoA
MTENSEQTRPRVTVIVPCRDEIHRLPDFVTSLQHQTLPPDQIVVADGMSTDGTRAWLHRIAQRDPRIAIVDNPDRIVPAALNVALSHAEGEIVARMDTHADYPEDYLQTLVGFLVDNEEVAGVGGAMVTRGTGPWGRAIAATLRRPFGLGGARHRVGGRAGPITHVFSGCYRREALDAAGGWDTRLRANEDYEADLRVAKAHGEVWLVNRASTTWYVRESLPGLARQMWNYGFHKALTMYLHPSSIKIRQLVPPSLVISLLIGPIAHRRLRPLPLLYLAASAAVGAAAARSDGAEPGLGALVPATVHLSWGAGLIVGLLRFLPEGRRGPVGDEAA